MIGIAIIAILASTGTVAVYSNLPEWRLKKIARSIYGDMSQSKISAIRNKRNCAMIFNIANNQYTICTDSGDGDWATMADNTVLRSATLNGLKDGIEFGYANANTNAHPAGGAMPDGDGIDNDNDAAMDEADELTDYDSFTLVFTPQGISNAGFVYVQNDNNLCFAIGTTALGVIRIRKWYQASGNWE